MVRFLLVLCAIAGFLGGFNGVNVWHPGSPYNLEIRVLHGILSMLGGLVFVVAIGFASLIHVLKSKEQTSFWI